MARIQSIMATSIAIDTVSASKSVRSLGTAIRSATNAWKAEETQAKSTSNYLGAAKARYEGLGTSIELLQKKISLITEKMKSLDTSTDAGQRAYSRYTNQLASAERQLASMTAQQQRAKSALQYQKSGLGELQERYRSLNSVSESYINRLKSEGNSYAASKAQLVAYRGALNNLLQQQKIQKDELNKIAEESGKSSDAYKTQQIRVNETSTSINNLTAKIKNSEFAVRSQKSGLSSLKNEYQKINSVSKSYIDRFRAEGKEYEVTKTQVNAYKESISNLTKQLKLQQAELTRIESVEGKTSKAYTTQQVRINETAKSIANLNSKLKSAQSAAKAQESGLNDLQNKYRSMNSVATSYIERLKSQGKEYEAAKVKLNNYKKSVANLVEQQKIQQRELARVAGEFGKSSSAYHKQEIEVNKTATSINKLNTKIKSTQSQINRLNPNGFNRVANGAKHVTNVTNKMKDGLHRAWDNVKSGATVAAGAIGALGAAAISGAKKAGNLEQSYREITNLAVLGGEKEKEVTKSVMEMQSQGRDMSIQYGKSQQSIAEAYEDLIKRGYTTKQALGAMRTELQGSVASGDDFADVVKVSSQTLEGFGMRAKTTGGMIRNTKTAVNELAYAADMTSTGFKDIGVGMAYVGSTAHQAGMSLAETASSMGILSNNGLEASQAGTGLRKVINSLNTAISNIGNKKSPLRALGITKKDLVESNGQMKPLAQAMGVLNAHMRGMSKVKKLDLMKTLFGTTGQQAGLILAENNKELKELTKNTDSAGKKGDYVAKLAQKNSQTAKMQIARAKQSLNAFEMDLGAKLLPAINKAGNELAHFLTTKDGKEFEKDVGGAITSVANGLIKLIDWSEKHKTAVKWIAGGFLASYSVIKGAKFLQFLNNTHLAFADLRSSSKIVDGLTKSVGKLVSATKGSGKGLSGLLTPMRKAGGFKNLTTAGKVGTVTAGAGVAVDAGSQFFNAFKDRHNADKRSQDIGKGIGAGIGGGIGLYFGGPLGAALGSKIGGFIGKWGGEGVNQFTKGWQRQGKKQKPQNWVQWLGFQAHNSLDFFVGLGKKAITAVSKGFNSAKSFAKKNSKELALTAVSPLIGIPALLYKNSPKFKKWADGVGKSISKGFESAKKGVGNFVKDSGKNISAFNKSVGKKTDQTIKWFKKLPANMHKGWKQGVEKSHKVMSKFWKDTGKGWNGFWKGVNSNRYVKAFKKGKFFSTAVKDMKSRWKSFSKDFGKKWKSTWKSAQTNGKNFNKTFVKNWNGTWKKAGSKWNGFKKSFSKSWSGAWKSVNSNRYVKAFKKGQFFQTALKDMKSRWSSFQKDLGEEWNSFWKSTQKWAKSSWDGTVKNWNGTWSSIGKGWSSFKNNFGKGWTSFWSKLEDNVKAFGKTVKDDFTGSINNIIGGFNDVVHALGGGKKTIGYLKFADGTDWRKRWGTPAIVNDAPGPNYREGLIDTDGSVIPFPAKRNLKWWLMPGQDIINGDDMAKHFGSAVHYADGSVHLSNNHKYSAKLVGIAEKRYRLAKRKYDEDKKRHDDDKHRREKKYRNPTRERKGMRYLDSSFFTGGKNTGHIVEVSESWLKKYIESRLPKRTSRSRSTRSRRRSTTRRRSSTRRRSTSRRSRTVTRKEHTIVTASVRGIKSIRSLSRAIKSVRGKHRASVKVSASGTKSVKSLASAVSRIKGGSHKVKVTVSGLKSAKSMSSAIKKIKGGTHKVKVKTSGVSGLKSLQKNITSVHSRVNSLTKALRKDKFGNDISSQAEKADKTLKGKGNFAKTFSSMTSKFDKDLNRMSKNSKKEFKEMWSSIEHSAKSGENATYKSLTSFSSKYKNGWSSLENGVHSTYGHFWTSMQNTAGKGLNKVISILNSGIRKIDSVISDFGGNKNAVHTVSGVRYATGTGFFGSQRRPITKPTLAVLNDGDDSPQTGNREGILDKTTGTLSVVNGRNVPIILDQRHEVLNASEMRELGLTHYATGTGALKQLYEAAKRYWNKPTQTGNSMFGQVSGLAGGINSLAKGMQDKAQHQGIDWWSQLWKMVEDKVNDDDLGPASGLLKAVEELGRNKHYSQSRRMSKFYADCSSLVSRALAKYYHVSWATPNGGALVVSGLWEHAHRISRAEAKPGDPVFWLPNEHVGVYAGHGEYYSAYGPNEGGPVGMQKVAPGAVFGRFDGINTEGDKSSKNIKIKANSTLQKQIRSQVGKGFWRTIQKIADKYGDGGAGNVKLTGDITHKSLQLAKALKHADPKSTAKGMAALISNAITESALNPSVTNSIGATGLWQFYAARKSGLESYANSNHGSYHNAGMQIDYALHGDSKNGLFKSILEGNRSPYNMAYQFSRQWEVGGYDAQHASHATSLYKLLKSHGYANGGIITTPQLALVGEGNGPETIVPWDITKRAKAYRLLDATLRQFKREDSPFESTGGTDSKLLTEMLKVMTSIDKKLSIEINETRKFAQQPINISGDFNMDGRSFAKYIRRFLREMDRQTVNRGRYNLSDR